MKINYADWVSFEVSRVFTIKSPAKRSMKSYTQGTTPYVSSSGVNNGIISYLEPRNNEILEKGNCITVSPLEGTAAFFQENDFLGRGGAGSAISLLYNDNLNKYNALFMCTIIKICARKFDYADAFTSDNLRTLQIPLPAKKNSDNSLYCGTDNTYSDKGYVPDWSYMNEYMLAVEEEAQARIEVLKHII